MGVYTIAKVTGGTLTDCKCVNKKWGVWTKGGVGVGGSTFTLSLEEIQVDP